MSDVVSELCALIEPVLASYGIPLTGLPLSRVGHSPNLRADGDGDRGDMTSDVAEAVLNVVLSHTSVNGDRLSWRELYEHDYAKWQRDRRFASLLTDLDRCEHGRHEGDPCTLNPGCGGPSRGNPLWRVGHAGKRHLAADLASRPVDEAYERFWDRFGESGAWPERMVGFTLDGTPIRVPEGDDRQDPEAWVDR